MAPNFDDYTIGKPFIELPSVDSTNNYALAQIHANVAQAGSCYFAHHQTAGKGQIGKTWIAQESSNILASIVITPSFLNLSQQFFLNACIAVAVRHFFSKYAGEETSIKWPNDIYWKNKKGAGILIENIISNQQWKWCVAGIGININQTEFDNGLKNPVSLKQITGKTSHVIELTKELCGDLNKYYHKLINEGPGKILELYRSHLYKKNKTVRLKKGNRIFDATIKSVTDHGKLIIENNFEEEINFGEIEWL